MKLLCATPTGCRRTSAMAAVLLLALAMLVPAAHSATLNRGFVDDVWFDAPAHGVSQHSWVTRTARTGARLVQIEVDWRSLEPRAPTSQAGHASPSARQFGFAALDQRVETFRRSGLQVVFLVTDAPRWAEGRGGTRTEYASGGYKPSAAAFGRLGEALARRYSGSYPDPLHRGRKLPRVRYMQAWAEANMNLHLSPQWTRVSGRAVNTGASIYRGLLNAFYAGVKAGDRHDVVIASGLESYGDGPFQGYQRTHPVVFLENVLCLSSTRTRVACAGGAAHFDVMASDPYEAFAPNVPAVSPLDASAPDLGRLAVVVRAAVAAHTLLPDGHKPLWVTEFGYDSNPPNHANGALSTATQARWLEQSFYIFWHEGVSTVLWYLVRDQPPPYTVNYASGVYFRTGKPKLSFTAYRFPFVVMSSGGASARAWGIAPVGGTVQVQFRSHGSWQTLRTFHAGAGTVFGFTSAALARGYYRATVNGQSSLPWHF